jgi:hypothetical protein
MEITRGIVRSYDGVNHEADVQLFGSKSTFLEDCPVAHHLGEELLTDGTLCLVLLFDTGDPGVVIATWEGTAAAWVTSALIKDGEVATADLADGAVTAAKIAADAVGSDEIAAGAVDTAELADSAVTSAKIADGTVAVGDLAFDPATQAELDAHEADANAHHTPEGGDVEVLLTEGTDLTWSNDASKKTLLSVTLPGGSLDADDLVKVAAAISVDNASGANRGITVRLELGSTIVASWTLNVTNGVHDHFDVQGRIQNDDSTSVQEGILVGLTKYGRQAVGISTGAEDTSGDLTIALTAQLQVAHASLTGYFYFGDVSVWKG